MALLALPYVQQNLIVTEFDPRTESRTLAFRDLNGNYPFSLSDGSFVFGPDSEGIDMPPREIVTRAIPGLEGERLAEIKVGPREVFLPLTIHSDSHYEHLDKRDQLARLFNHRQVDYRTLDGTLDLVANSIRGERSLRCVYVDGMTSGRAPNERSHWQKLGVTLRAVRPYWIGAPWSTPEIRLPSPVAWFGTFPGGITSGNAIGGTVTVTVEGDAESWTNVDIVGPAVSAVITGPGFRLTIPDGLVAGEVFRLQSDPRNRTALFDGVKNWTRVGPSDRYSPLNPGDRLFKFTLTGATAETMVRMSGATSFERPW